MASGRPPGGPSDPPPPRRRGSVPNEAGLRALGSSSPGSSGEAPVANEQGLRTLGAQIDRASSRPGRTRRGRRRWSRRRKVVTGLLTVVVLLGLLVGGIYGYARYRYDQIQKVHVAADQQAAAGQPFNLLVIGSDSREGLSSAQQAQDGTASAVGGQRSDVTMIWHVVPSTKQITIISIPRDTLVSMVGGDVATFGTFNRINSSYDEGPNQLVQTIEANFGIPINHVMQVNFNGFEGAVNALGGVYLNFNYPAKDSLSGLNITQTGCQLLNGQEALAVARSRHYYYYQNGEWQYDGTSDFGRIQRQDAFLRALIDTAKTKYNPLTLNALIGSIPHGLKIDDNFSLGDLVGLAEDFHSVNANALGTTTLPTISDGDVQPWGDVLFVDQPAAQQLLVSTFGSQLTTPTQPPPNTSLHSTPPPVVTPTTAPATTGSTAGTTTTTAAPPPSFDPTPCTPH